MPRGSDSRLGPLAHLGHPVFAHAPLSSQCDTAQEWGSSSLAPVPLTLLVPDTSTKKKGHRGREGGRSPARPGKGHCPLLRQLAPTRREPWPAARLHLGTLAGHAGQSPRLASLCQAGQARGQRRTFGPGLGVATAGNSKHCTLKPKAP